MEALAGGCDLLIIPSTPDRLSLDALVDTVTVLRSLGSNRYRILLTMVPPPPSRAGESARAVLEEAGFPLFGGSIRRYTAFQTASDQITQIWATLLAKRNKPATPKRPPPPLPRSRQTLKP